MKARARRDAEQEDVGSIGGSSVSRKNKRRDMQLKTSRRGQYVFVSDKKLAYALCYLLDIPPFLSQRDYLFYSTREFWEAVEHLQSYNNPYEWDGDDE